VFHLPETLASAAPAKFLPKDHWHRSDRSTIERGAKTGDEAKSQEEYSIPCHDDEVFYPWSTEKGVKLQEKK